MQNRKNVGLSCQSAVDAFAPVLDHSVPRPENISAGPHVEGIREKVLRCRAHGGGDRYEHGREHGPKPIEPFHRLSVYTVTAVEFFCANLKYNYTVLRSYRF